MKFIIATFFAVLCCSTTVLIANALPLGETSSKNILGDFNVHAEIQSVNDVPLSDCKEIHDANKAKPTGLYTVVSDELRRFQVYCDMSLKEGGWTVLMRRKSDEFDFNRNWTQYRNGFGDLNGNFWIGLENMHALTQPSRGRFQLYVGLESHDDYSKYPAIKGETKFAMYNSFKIGDKSSYYQLTISGYDKSSTAGDSLGDHDDSPFSTPDADHDESPHSSCASKLKSGWWFKNCLDSNLAGKWQEGGKADDLSGIVWETFKGEKYSLKYAMMAIRRIA